MAFKDYSNTPADNTTLGDGTYIGPNMLRNKVRPALQQIAADGRDLYDEVVARGAGGALPAFIQAGTSAVERTVQAKLRDIISIKDFGAVGDGVADDTAAIQAAVTSLVATGGSIVFPRGRYKVTASITISSLFHIGIMGEDFGQVYDTNGPGIAIAAAVASVFRVQAPTTRGTCGGVTFSGLSFYDATGSGGAPGTNTITNAVLDLYDAPQSSVEDCQFHFIKGSAIKTDFFVMGSITGCRFRYCGVTGKKVLHLGSTNTTYASQSVVVHDCRVEVCYGDAYVYSDANSQAVTISSCGFEAATTEYPTSSVPYLDINGTDYKVTGCSFNRNLAQAVILRGRGIVASCSFATGAAATNSLYIPGDRNVITGNTFSDLRTGISVRALGVLNVIDGNSFYSSGGISLEGANNEFSDNVVDAPTMTGGGDLLALGDYCTATGNQFNAYDFGATGYVPAVHVAGLNGANCIFSLNSCRGWTGKTFIRVTNATASFQPNTHDGVGTFASASVTLNSVASAGTLTLPYGPHLVTVTGTTGITSITAGMQWAGQQVTLVFAGALTMTDGGNLKLASSYTTTADDTITLGSDGVSWFEIGRSVN